VGGLVVAVWGLLAGTRLLRGEEEAGRVELLLAGPSTRRRAAAAAVTGLGVGLLVLWTVTAAVTVAVGRSGRGRPRPSGCCSGCCGPRRAGRRSSAWT